MKVIINTLFTTYKKEVSIKSQAVILDLASSNQKTTGVSINGVQTSSSIFSRPLNFGFNVLFLHIQKIQQALGNKEPIQIINDTQFDLSLYKRYDVNYGAFDNTSIIMRETALKIEK